MPQGGGHGFPGRAAGHPCKSGCGRRNIRLIESNAKCRYLKKLTFKGDFAAGVLSVLAPSPSMTAYSPSLMYTLYSNGKTSLVHIEHFRFLPFVFIKNESSLFFVISSTKSLSNLFASLRYYKVLK